ncbi:6-phosphofructokinase [Lentisphaerota bacterium WC36G]|nr:6-phosphofructokinase [Lentisphaerae bacterium WC36]
MTQQQNKAIAILTSGGDAPGMNAALRSAVRTALNLKFKVYAIFEGYEGLIRGGNLIQEFNWASVGGILSLGGTAIGTARSMEFQTFEGRLKAAKNLIDRNITNLIVIGGDGSLSGANSLAKKWNQYLEKLLQEKQITPQQAHNNSQLSIVGLVGSIDNDMVNTDMTIGTDSALHRIVEAIDAINDTAASHHRTFIIEVMGRNCGYLALASALATSAEFVLIPENPPAEGWEDDMCELIQNNNMLGRNHSIIIVAEGALDQNGDRITSQYIKDVLSEKINCDARITILGHVQRGGSPSAFDRYMSTVLGYKAVNIFHDKSDNIEAEPKIVGLKNNRLNVFPLADAVKQTKAIPETLKKRDFSSVMALRGGHFEDMYEIFKIFSRALPHKDTTIPKLVNDSKKNIAVINCGWSASGMNTAVKTALRLAIHKGHNILGINNGFSGFLNREISLINNVKLEEYCANGGSFLGTNRDILDKVTFCQLANVIKEYQIDALIMIGGLSGYINVYNIYLSREQHPELKIPIICVPATINNNIPGTEFCIGADTALNTIVNAVDKIKYSSANHRRTFIVEVMGRKCGYLAMMTGLATGAEYIYLPEESLDLEDFQKDIKELNHAFANNRKIALIVRNEEANDIYDTDFLRKLYQRESKGLFDVRTSILGPLQQGGRPTVFDRITAIKLVDKAVDLIDDAFDDKNKDIKFLGLIGGKVISHDIEHFKNMVHVHNDRPKDQWWMKIRDIVKLLSSYRENN